MTRSVDQPGGQQIAIAELIKNETIAIAAEI
jgi:hypothetical protein